MGLPGKSIDVESKSGGEVDFNVGRSFCFSKLCYPKDYRIVRLCVVHVCLL